MTGDGRLLTRHLVCNLANQAENQMGGMEAHLPEVVNPGTLGRTITLDK